MDTGFIESVKVIGLGATLAVGAFLLLAYVIRHFVKSISEERQRWISMADNHIKHNTEVQSSMLNEINRFSERSDEAHKYTREEHKEMLTKLTKLEGGQ